MKFNTKILHGKAGRNTPDGGVLEMKSLQEADYSEEPSTYSRI